jgi:hypothetical protein
MDQNKRTNEKNGSSKNTFSEIGRKLLNDEYKENIK